jgi:hypothetical protein
MTCKDSQTGEIFKYSFLNEDVVELKNKDKTFKILYKDWLKRYFILNKL